MQWLNSVILSMLVVLSFERCDWWPFGPEDPPGPTIPQLHVVNKLPDSALVAYVGVPLKFWAEFPIPASDTSQVSWEMGLGSVYGTKPSGEVSNIGSDTILIEWTGMPLPEPYFPEDSNDPEFYDTVRVLANGVVSEPLVVRIDNVFPRIDSVVVNGIRSIFRNDSIYLRVHRGGTVELKVHYFDPLKPTLNSINFPDFMKVNGKNPSRDPFSNENVAIYQLTEAPIGEYDESGMLIVKDGSGGQREWIIRYQTYQEAGSLWVGSPGELIKLSGDALEIFRTSLVPKDRTIMDVSNNAIYLVTTNNQILEKFSTLNFKTFSGFKSYQSIRQMHGLEVENEYMWIAEDDESSVSGSVIRQFEISSIMVSKTSLKGIPGRVLSMSPDKDQTGGIWFINSEEDHLFFAVGDSIHVRMENILPNPKAVSYDASVQFCWVASSSEIVMVDRDGNRYGSIRGFTNIVSISAGLGFCLVVDRFSGKLYSFDHSIWEDRLVSDNLFPSEYSRLFAEPVHVSMARQVERYAWVADEGAGSIVKIDSKGREVARFVGNIAPQTLSINQGN